MSPNALTMDSSLLKMYSNGGLLQHSTATTDDMNKQEGNLSRLAEIAQVFTSNQQQNNNNNNNSSSSKRNITDVLRNNKRSSMAPSSGFHMPGFSNPMMNPSGNSASTPSSAIRAAGSVTTNVSNSTNTNGVNPFKRQKMDSNSMTTMLVLQQQQQQQQQRQLLQQIQQQQLQGDADAEQNSDENSGEDAASYDGLEQDAGEEDTGSQQRKQQNQQGQPEQDGGVRFREYQAEIWSEKFEELCLFRRQQGHCHVPHHYTENQGLAQWVKRQRYQYKLKLDGKRSTLSDERVRLLNKIGFIWNSHDAVWEERLQDLMLFKQIHGHCMVPSNFEPNVQLAIWIKRQRRQYKKYQAGTASSMTPERIGRLEAIGFVWDCRKQSKQQQQGQQQQQQHQQALQGGHGGDFSMALAAMAKGGGGGNSAAMLAQHQQQQVLLMQMQLMNQQAARVSQAGLDSREGETNDEDAVVTNEDASQEEEVAQPDTANEQQDRLDQRALVVPAIEETNGNQPQQEDAPVRIPRCEFFSFSRKFHY